MREPCAAGDCLHKGDTVEKCTKHRLVLNPEWVEVAQDNASELIGFTRVWPAYPAAAPCPSARTVPSRKRQITAPASADDPGLGTA